MAKRGGDGTPAGGGGDHTDGTDGSAGGRGGRGDAEAWEHGGGGPFHRRPGRPPGGGGTGRGDDRTSPLSGDAAGIRPSARRGRPPKTDRVPAVSPARDFQSVCDALAHATSIPDLAVSNEETDRLNTACGSFRAAWFPDLTPEASARASSLLALLAAGWDVLGRRIGIAIAGMKKRQEVTPRTASRPAGWPPGPEMPGMSPAPAEPSTSAGSGGELFRPLDGSYHADGPGPP